MCHLGLMENTIYRLADVARGANVPRATVSSWLNRGHIELVKKNGDRDTRGPGDHRLFSWQRLINIATVAELARIGIPPHEGTSRLALTFSHLGETVPSFDDKLRSGRDAGRLFPEGRTWFVVFNLDGELEAAVLNKLDENSFLTYRDRTASSAVAIDMNKLVRAVAARLQQDDRNA
jgi:hypothetical protein